MWSVWDNVCMLCLSVRGCIFMYLCVYVSLCFSQNGVWVCVPVSLCVCVCDNVCTSVYLYVWLYLYVLCVYVGLCVSLRVLCVCVCICMCLCVQRESFQGGKDWNVFPSWGEKGNEWEGSRCKENLSTLKTSSETRGAQRAELSMIFACEDWY